MNNLNSCSCASGGGIEDLLKCAPCPPPFLTYIQLKLTAVGHGKLCKKEVCSIARNCNMSESTELTLDCPEEHINDEFKCDVFCMIVILAVLSVAILIITIIAVYKRRRAGIKQDTINVVFNDTDSETSGKSSERGSINIVQVQAECHDDRGTWNEDDKDDKGGMEHELKGFGKGEEGFNGHSQETRSDFRSRANNDKNDRCVVAKL